MFCIECGKPAAKQAKFCFFCGTKTHREDYGLSTAKNIDDSREILTEAAKTKEEASSTIDPVTPSTETKELSNEKEGIKHSNTEQVRPWIRFLARQIDFALLTILVVFLFLTGMLPISNQGEPSVAALIPIIGSICFFVFAEIIMLWMLGTTPGKALFKIYLSKNNGGKVDFSTACSRTILVWFKGLGLAIPVISLFTLITSYFSLRKNGTTSWDKSSCIKVEHGNVGGYRVFFALVFIVLTPACLRFIDIAIVARINSPYEKPHIAPSNKPNSSQQQWLEPINPISTSIGVLSWDTQNNIDNSNPSASCLFINNLPPTGIENFACTASTHLLEGANIVGIIDHGQSISVINYENSTAASIPGYYNIVHIDSKLRVTSSQTIYPGDDSWSLDSPSNWKKENLAYVSPTYVDDYQIKQVQLTANGVRVIARDPVKGEKTTQHLCQGMESRLNDTCRQSFPNCTNIVDNLGNSRGSWFWAAKLDPRFNYDKYMRACTSVCLGRSAPQVDFESTYCTAP